MAIESLDEYSAVSEAGGSADRLAARVAVGTRSTFTALPSAFVAGVSRAVPLRRPRRVDILSLDRQKRLYDDSGLPSIESAFELVSHLDYGQGPVAVAGGWSAVEFLLTAPGDKGNVLEPIGSRPSLPALGRALSSRRSRRTASRRRRIRSRPSWQHFPLTGRAVSDSSRRSRPGGRSAISRIQTSRPFTAWSDYSAVPRRFSQTCADTLRSLSGGSTGSATWSCMAAGRVEWHWTAPSGQPRRSSARESTESSTLT